METCKIIKKCYFLAPLVAALSRHRGMISESWWCCFDSDTDSDTDSDSWLLTDSDPDSERHESRLLVRCHDSGQHRPRL